MKAQVTFAKGNVVKETEKAICLNLGRGDVWFPKSQIDLDMPKSYNDTGAVAMPIWLAKKAGLWGYNCFGSPVCQLIED